MPESGAIVQTAAKLACIIALQTLALVVLNVGARDPLALARAVVGAKSMRALAYGVVSLLIGVIFLAAATMLAISVVGPAPHLFLPLELFTFVIAIIIDALIGNELRRAAHLS